MTATVFLTSAATSSYLLQLLKAIVAVPVLAYAAYRWQKNDPLYCWRNLTLFCAGWITGVILRFFYM